MNDLVPNPFGARPPAAATAGHVAMQSRELAEMQTRYLMAQQFPRDERKALDGVVNAFSIPAVAERAEYEYARGGTDISGASIHAAQAIAQQWGNIEFGWRELSRGVGHDGVEFSEIEAYAVDLQGRVPSRITFPVRHWRDTKRGGYKLTDDRDIYEATANNASRRKRACILSVIPQYVIDAAMQQARATLKAKADTSPEAMAKLVEAFAAYGVDKEAIEKLIQRRLSAITPAQVMRLRRIFASLRDGMSEAGEWFELGAAGGDGDDKPAGPPTSAADAIAKRRAARKTAAPPPPAAESPAPAPGPDAGAPPLRGLAFYLARIQATTDDETATLILDDARGELTDDETRQLVDAYNARFREGG